MVNRSPLQEVSMLLRANVAAALLVLALPAGGGTAQVAKPPTARAGGDKAAPTAEEARRFVEAADARLLGLAVEAEHASWVQANFITEDTEFLSAAATKRAIEAAAELAKQATRFDGLQLPADVQRKLTVLKVGLTLAAPAGDAEAAELTRIVSSMEGEYGRGKWCHPGKDGKEECLDINGVERILSES